MRRSRRPVYVRRAHLDRTHRADELSLLQRGCGGWSIGLYNADLDPDGHAGQEVD